MAADLTDRERELVLEAISEYVERCREDEDEHNSAIADELEIAAEKI